MSNKRCYYCGTHHGEDCPEFPSTKSVAPKLSTTVTVVLVVFLVALFAALALSSCAHVTRPTPSGASCEEVCTRAEKMGCGWAAPTPMGATCAVVCLNAETVGVPWKTDCLVGVQSCDENCP